MPKASTASVTSTRIDTIQTVVVAAGYRPAGSCVSGKGFVDTPKR